MKASRKGMEIGRQGPAARDKGGGRGTRSGDQNTDAEYLDGQMLIAMPVMDDPRFAQSVIYPVSYTHLTLPTNREV